MKGLLIRIERLAKKPARAWYEGFQILGGIGIDIRFSRQFWFAQHYFACN